MFLYKSIEIRNRISHSLKRFSYTFFEKISSNNEYGERCEAYQRQLPIAIKHHTHDGKDGQYICYDRNQTLRENFIDCFYIIDGSGSEGAYCCFIVKAGVLKNNLFKDVFSQVIHYGLPQPVDGVHKPKT